MPDLAGRGGGLRGGSTVLGHPSVTDERLDPGDLPGGLPRNFPRPCLLLLIGERPSHGYDLLERLRLLWAPTADPGGLYRALRQMEREGLVSSCWETSVTGPARRTYTLTAGGWRWLHAWAAAIAESRLVLSSYLRRYDALTSSDEPRDPIVAGAVGAARP